MRESPNAQLRAPERRCQVLEKCPPGTRSGRAFPIWSGREDLNLRRPEPHKGDGPLSGCRQASPCVAGRRRPGGNRRSLAGPSSPCVATCCLVLGLVTTKRNYQLFAVRDSPSLRARWPNRPLSRKSLDGFWAYRRLVSLRVFARNYQDQSRTRITATARPVWTECHVARYAHSDWQVTGPGFRVSAVPRDRGFSILHLRRLKRQRLRRDSVPFPSDLGHLIRVWVPIARNGHGLVQVMPSGPISYASDTSELHRTFTSNEYASARCHRCGVA